jgi:NAD(P)-dependent dehydrogenase (short-subunit alcohol dehydrogenase family)
VSDVVLVTGAAGAIGSAAVRTFRDAGFRVVGLDRDPAVEAAPEGCVGVTVDLEREEDVRRAIDSARGLGRLRHVVGVAGGALPEEPARQSDPAGLPVELFRRSIEANLVTQYIVLVAALPWLRADPEEDRSITFTSSFNALTGAGMPAYSAAKAALTGLARALAPPLGCEGIRVNVVAPGTIRTPRTERIWSDAPGHFERLEAGTALGRLGSPEDVARAYLALATVLTHVTGQVLVVDGGQMVTRPESPGVSPD